MFSEMYAHVLRRSLKSLAYSPRV